MPQVNTYRLVLVGHFAGRTVNLSGFQFKDGVLELYGTDIDVAGPIRYLGKSYQAFLEGSDEFEAAQDVLRTLPKEKSNGKRDLSGSNAPEGKSDDGGVQPDGEGSSEEAPVESVGDGADTSGDAGGDPGGAGHENPGMDGDPAEGRHNYSSDQMKLREAVMSLDPNDLEIWTDAGLPTMLAVQEAYGSGDVTRRMVSDIAGDWTQAKALEAHELSSLME